MLNESFTICYVYQHVNYVICKIIIVSDHRKTYLTLRRKFPDLAMIYITVSTCIK